MKKRVLFLLSLLSVISVAFPTISFAHYHPAYLRSFQEFKHTNENWMANIKDETKMSQLSIPGTHDTMSNGPGGDIVQTQGLSLAEQLKVGIRFVDIRARAIDNALAIHHEFVYLHANFSDVLTTIKQFLQNQPTETVYMRLKQEYSSVSGSEFGRIFNTYLNQPQYKNLFYDEYSNNPTLGATRGKIVLLPDGFSPSVGIYYSRFNIQDQYQLKTNWDLYDKWLAIKKHLIKTDQDKGNETYINYLSGSTGAFPYFVASGHSSPGTSAPRLATGLTHPGWASSYPDFPRVNWFLGIATIAFEGTNILTANFIENSQIQHTGIIAADFPGYGLIDNVIKANKKYQKSHVPIPDGLYQIATSLDHHKVVDLTGADQGRQIVIWGNHGGGNQKWYFKYEPAQKAYQILAAENKNEVLAWNRYRNSNQVFGTPNRHYPEHYWELEAIDGNYRIRNKANREQVLDVDGYYPNQGVKIKMNQLHPLTAPQRPAQEFKLMPVK